MFEVGALIIYGGEGVCRVDEIGCPDIPAINKGRLYYTLNPLYREGKTYAPTDTSVFMRPVLSYEEAQELIRAIPTIFPDICTDGNPRVLAEHYEGRLKTRDCADLVQVIKTVCSKQQLAQEQKKKVGLVDERYMKRAEELLYGELAVALGISKEEVPAYIASIVEGREPSAVG